MLTPIPRITKSSYGYSFSLNGNVSLGFDSFSQHWATITLMPQILDTLPEDDADRLCCCYVNTSSQIQVARITNIENWYFERVVFPGQRLIFEAPPTAYLEIHTGMMASAILSDRIPCQQLLVLGDEEPFYLKSIAPQPDLQCANS
jgi:Domain of unknown function (DUF1830)